MSFWNAKDAKSVEVLPGVTRQLIGHGEQSLAVRFLLSKDSSVPNHTHPHEQLGFLASGKIEMTIGDETRALEVGDSYCIPPNILHGATATEDSVVVDVFAPPREDYLP